MLRASLRSAQAVGRRSLAAPAARNAQWPTSALAARRCFADNKKPSVNDPTPVKLPGSETVTAADSQTPVVKLEPATSPKDVPLTPPAPAVEAKLPPPPPPAPVKKKKGFFRRLRNLILTISILGAITFGGGVWYSRINDNFHDFFTEYVPFGEQAVLYFEELDFRKRHPRPVLGTGVKDTSPQVKISPQSGASWRVADSGEPAGRQSSAVAHTAKKSAENVAQKVDKAKTTVKAGAEKAGKTAKKAVETSKPAEEASAPAVAKSSSVPFKAPEVDEPSRFPPAGPIDPLKVKDANEPVVQALVKMLNDIITVVNADNADDRFSSTITKAKGELQKVGDGIRAIKEQVEKDAAAEVASKVTEFQNASSELINSVERIMAAQESQWRTDFEEEMKRIQSAYDARIKTEIEREQQVNEEKLKNKLVEQAVSLKRQFLKEISDHVESERGSRLGKLDQLSSAVSELQQLTTGWNDVVDLNLKTQQLHVAVEAVRASLEDATHPRPFVRELVALKEIATDDPVVNAAIASINPSAYQRGISPPAQLIDRFRRVAAEVRKASLLPEDAGVASHASSLLLSKLMFKKQGLADGNDVESILTRTQTFLEEGDLDAAAREMNSLQGWAKTLSRDWLGEVRKVLEVQQALDKQVIATEARLQSLKVE
ncbi:mitofilin [Microdochium trichocladiopsis]|uniref:MICOS complex subunit MIC60 n=1 Tax=Microdochium trichocladiopsis TaxID=1682393 RepID=A0A9P9BJR4_9PEZI|nr:mitofilin [Microdochium trichocladiopsis]KAH7018408.1 mitofilin [Microdochium trichocladiopsis]